MNRTQTAIRQRGMTLVELMVAMLIGVFLMAGLIGLFVNSKQNYRLQENMSRSQENARFAMHFLNRDIRMADFRACGLDARVPTAINGVDNYPVDPDDDFVDGTDSITVTQQTNLCGVAAATSSITYSIRNGAGGNPSLFRDGAEIVEGIENMQLRYGLDTDGDGSANYFIPAGAGLTLPQRGQVVSVNLTLTAVTLEGGLTTTGDGRVRRDYVSTIALRNRLQ